MALRAPAGILHLLVRKTPVLETISVSRETRGGLAVSQHATENQARTPEIFLKLHVFHAKSKNSYFLGFPQIGKPRSELKRTHSEN